MAEWFSEDEFEFYLKDFGKTDDEHKNQPPPKG
jgi:hypothetical protein